MEEAAWAKACTAAGVRIVSRHPGGTYEDGYGDFHSHSGRLELEKNADQRAAAPGQTVVIASVDDYVYKRLEGKDSVRIYYLPGAPLAFFIEGEMGSWNEES